VDGFKKLPKMQCFKTGGSVGASEDCSGKKAYKDGGHLEKKEMASDKVQDKKLIKKAVAIHDKQEHPGEKTDLSSLRKGGRAKKETGTVKKYKTGGSTSYGAKKTAEDKKEIAKVKRTVPKKAATPAAPVTPEAEAEFPGMVDAAYKQGGGVHVHHHYPA
jgi:hypothetical protein